MVTKKQLESEYGRLVKIKEVLSEKLCKSPNFYVVWDPSGGCVKSKYAPHTLPEDDLRLFMAYKYYSGAQGQVSILKTKFDRKPTKQMLKEI